MSVILDQKIRVTCPRCARSYEVKLRDIRYERLTLCPSGHSVKVKDEGGGIRKVDQATEALVRSLKRLSK